MSLSQRCLLCARKRLYEAQVKLSVYPDLQMDDIRPRHDTPRDKVLVVNDVGFPLFMAVSLWAYT